MTEEEAKAELFRIHFEYMMNPPKVRIQKYDEYKKSREKIKQELTLAILERREKEYQSKTK